VSSCRYIVKADDMNDLPERWLVEKTRIGVCHKWNPEKILDGIRYAKSQHKTQTSGFTFTGPITTEII